MAYSNYGNEGAQWPVKPGEFWEVGDHRILCGDIEKGAAQKLFELVPRPTFVYCDPPWSPSLARYNRDKAGLDLKVSYKHLLLSIIAAVSVAERDVFIEMSRGESENRCMKALREAGATILGRWDITYYNTRPNSIIQALFSGCESRFGAVAELDGKDDEHTPLIALSAVAQPGESVYDCCTGRGLTLRTAGKLGLRFVGTELHPDRMATAIARYMAMFPDTPTPRRIGAYPEVASFPA